MMHKSTRIPDDRCPYCRHELSAAWEPGATQPRPDDFTLCIYCGGWLVFGEDMSVHEPDPYECKQLARSRQAKALHRLWVQFMKEKGARLQ